MLVEGRACLVFDVLSLCTPFSFLLLVVCVLHFACIFRYMLRCVELSPFYMYCSSRSKGRRMLPVSKGPPESSSGPPQMASRPPDQML